MAILFDNVTPASNQTYYDDLNAAPSGGSAPTISAIGALRNLGNATITGTNFGASQGAGGVTIGGVAQPIVSWSATSIVIGPIERGALLYGNRSVVVTSDADGSSVPSVQPLLPQTGWNYVNLVNPLASSGQRITAAPDLAGGDQLAWGAILPSGTVTVFSNATFTASSGVGQFSVEVNDGTGWGGYGIQSVANVVELNGVITARPATVAGSFSVTVPSPPVNEFPFSGSVRAAPATVTGSFLAFTSRAFSGAAVAGRALVQGVFNVIGAVAPPTTPPPTPPPGTGTPASKIAIVNRALVKLGSATIRSFTEDSKQARLATVLYDDVRDQELARHVWKFALYRRSLPEVVNDDPRGPYRYAYGKPTDWLTTVWIGTEKLGTPEAAALIGDEDWSHEGEFILSNRAPPLPLQYIRRITDPTRYHVLFIEALACRLAMEMADALTDSTTKWEKARTEYRDAIAEARLVNAIMDPPRSMASDSWLAARH